MNVWENSVEKNIVSTVIIMQIILFNKRNENVNFFDEKTKVNVKKITWNMHFCISCFLVLYLYFKLNSAENLLQKMKILNYRKTLEPISLCFIIVSSERMKVNVLNKIIN